MIDKENKEVVGIGRKAIKGATWSIGSQWVFRAIGMVSTIILARALTPDDFGIVAIVTAIYFMLESFTSIQPSAYLMRVTNDQYEKLIDTAFTITSIRGLIVSLFMLLLAFLLPQISSRPDLQLIMLVLSIDPLIAGMINPRIVEFTKDIDFSFNAKRQMITKLGGSAIAIIIAIVYESYWALVCGMLSKTIMYTVITYFVKPYRPRLRIRHAKDILAFSLQLSVVQIIDTVNNQMDRLIVGIGGFSNVGLYSVSKDFSWITAGEIFSSTSSVLFPTFKKFKYGSRELSKNVLESLSLLTAFALPWAVGAALIGPATIVLLYGSKWEAAAALVQPLMLTCAFQPATTIAKALILAHGKPINLLWRSVVAAVLQLSLLYVGISYFSLEIAVWLLLPVSIVIAMINITQVIYIANIRMAELFSATLRSWFSVAVMAYAIIFAQPYMPMSSDAISLFYRIFLIVLLGVTVYPLIHLSIWYVSGRPVGPESKALQIMKSRYQRIDLSQ